MINGIIPKLGAVAVAALLLGAVSAQASAEQRNPFAVPDVTVEQQREEEEKVREIIFRMIPEIATSVANRLQTTGHLQTGLDPAVAGIGGPSDSEEDQEEESDVSTLPEGSRFVACVNGKALYRDSDGNHFVSEAVAPTGIKPCAN